MKQLALLVLMTALCTFMFAGIDDYYTFNATTGTYTPITRYFHPRHPIDDALSEAIPLVSPFPTEISAISLR